MKYLIVQFRCKHTKKIQSPARDKRMLLQDYGKIDCFNCVLEKTAPKSDDGRREL